MKTQLRAIEFAQHAQGPRFDPQYFSHHQLVRIKKNKRPMLDSSLDADLRMFQRSCHQLQTFWTNMVPYICNPNYAGG